MNVEQHEVGASVGDRLSVWCVVRGVSFPSVV